MQTKWMIFNTYIYVFCKHLFHLSIHVPFNSLYGQWLFSFIASLSKGG